MILKLCEGGGGNDQIINKQFGISKPFNFMRGKPKEKELKPYVTSLGSEGKIRGLREESRKKTQQSWGKRSGED